MKSILHPTDFSETADQVFRLICPIARDQHAEIIVLHVISPDSVALEGRDRSEVGRDSALYEDSWEHFTKLQELAWEIPVSLQVKVGPLVNTIAKVATDERCEMIALASSHHSYMERQHHGTIPESLVHVVPCPVLCYRESCLQCESDKVVAEMQYALGQAELPLCSERQW